MKSKIAQVLVLFFTTTYLQSQTPVYQTKSAEQWADSTLASLTLEEKLGQLFMVAAYSNKGNAHEQEILNLVKNEKIGGLIFFQGGPGRQANLTNLYQSNTQIPLMIGIDGEWGLAMRLDSTFKFAWNMTLGAIQDSTLIYKIGYEMGLQHKRLGVHINFAPVLDINTNSKNPIINARSFGEDKRRVTVLSLALMKGMQDAGILACGKHFPGHGDTDSDSHKTLPTVGHSRDRLDDIELYPYSRHFKQGLASVMVAHLSVPVLDKTLKPASLSKPIVTDLLQNEMGFQGLIFTDALNMKGVSAKYAPGDVDLKAFKAGNDVLLFAENVPRAKLKLLDALANNEITLEQINHRVRKILMAKFFLGLNQKPVIYTEGLHFDLNGTRAQVLHKQAMEEALTLLINKGEIIPIKTLEKNKIALVQIGKNQEKAFGQALNMYTQVDVFSLGDHTNELLNKLSAYDLVIVGYHTENGSPWKGYKPTDAERLFVKKLTLQNKFILTIFANPYSLGSLPEAEQADGLIMAYQNNVEANQAAAQLIFGALAAKGRLPITASKLFDVGYGQQSTNLKRLRLGVPEEQGIDSKKLAVIESLVKQAINEGATPGAQVLIAKNGQIIYNRAFGYHEYDKKQPVQTTDVYDLASITKIAGSLPLIMKMYDEGNMPLDETLGKIYPRAIGSNKENLRVRDILAHQSGLPAWIPFYVKSMKNNRPDSLFYSENKGSDFNLQVSEHLFISSKQVDSIYKQIFAAPLGNGNYLYSDLGYYFFIDIIQKNKNKPLDQLADELFFSPLGATTLTYNPLKKIEKNRIPPTEDDKYFRFEKIQGHVNDQGAAMLGGVAGHAGLFSSAQDLAKLMQMYLDFGVYGGRRYIDSATVYEFIKCQFCEKNNRRGAGFDKPQLSGNGPTCSCVSMMSFGHTGFTGTMAWSDPDEKIVYIFLSNRTWPDAENKKLIHMDTRSKIQQVIYDSLNTYKL